MSSVASWCFLLKLSSNFLASLRTHARVSSNMLFILSSVVGSVVSFWVTTYASTSLKHRLQSVVRVVIRSLFFPFHLCRRPRVDKAADGNSLLVCTERAGRKYICLEAVGRSVILVCCLKGRLLPLVPYRRSRRPMSWWSRRPTKYLSRRHVHRKGQCSPVGV
jgi:hypothetical protein